MQQFFFCIKLVISLENQAAVGFLQSKQQPRKLDPMPESGQN